VKPFLFNLFSDPDIIKLPLSFIFQKLLATIIVKSRGKEAQENYQKMGGGSPQLPITYEQGRAVKEQLLAQGLNCSVGIAMRYWHPFTEQTLQALRDDGVEQLVLASLYPHFSYTTTGSNLNEIKRVLKRMNWEVPVTTVSGYCKEEWYLNALADRIQDGLNTTEWTCPVEEVRILFSAHSLPEQHVKRTGDPYKKLIDQCAADVMSQYFPQHPWDMAYQSKVGKMPWIGPSTEGVLSYYAGKSIDNILIVPISFVSDHIETLVEIDLDYIEWAREEGISCIGRAPVMNTCPLFINGFSQRILSQIEGRLPKGQSVLNGEINAVTNSTVAVPL
jgi:ferrochelatase